MQMLSHLRYALVFTSLAAAAAAQQPSYHAAQQPQHVGKRQGRQGGQARHRLVRHPHRIPSRRHEDRHRPAAPRSPGSHHYPTA